MALQYNVKSTCLEDRAHGLVEACELEIDGEGRIWRVGRRCGAGRGRSVVLPVARKRAEYAHPRGYLFVATKKGGKRVQVLAHRLVWTHFHGRIPAGLTINHKDGIKTNNAPSNLELATHGEQALHALHVIQTRVPTAGERSWTAKLQERDVLIIRKRVAAGERQKDLAREFGVDASSISSVIHGRTWECCGEAGFIRTHKTWLKPGDEERMVEMLKQGATGRAVAKAFGVSPAAICRFKARHFKG